MTDDTYSNAELGLGHSAQSAAADAVLLARAAEIAEHARHLARSDADLRSA